MLSVELLLPHSQFPYLERVICAIDGFLLHHELHIFQPSLFGVNATRISS